jgi:hypothetical protein
VIFTRGTIKKLPHGILIVFWIYIVAR